MQLISYQVINATTKIDLQSDNEDVPAGNRNKRIQMVVDTSLIPEPIAVSADALFAYLCQQYALNAWNFNVRKSHHPRLGVQFSFSYAHWVQDTQQATTKIPNIANDQQMVRHWKWLENMLCEHYQGLVRMTDLQLALAF